MPKYYDMGPFQVREDFDYAKHIAERIEEVRQAFQKRLSEIECLSDPAMQKMCICSLIDCLAQEWSDYPTSNTRETFCKFVSRFQTKYSYLNEIEPVTLFYRIEKIIEEKPILPDFPPEPVVSIEELVYVEAMTFTEVLSSGFSGRVKNYAREKLGDHKADNLEKQHTICHFPISQMLNPYCYRYSFGFIFLP